jgi:16S rRNA processing protein RimM
MAGQKPTKDWATIGKIVAPFGLRGDVKVFSLSDIPDRFAKLKQVYLTPDYQRYTLTGVRPHKGDIFLLKFAGFDDATSAEKLRNREICIPESELADLPPDSYYQHDILGLRVALLNDRTVGVIRDILETGSNDIYVLDRPNGKQAMIPAIKDIVKQVDLIRRVMYIDPIPGLLDETEAEVVAPDADS